jgi:DNA-binding PadR family transcriptional regulator
MVPMDFPKELVAASATPIILAILEQGDSYGYAIIRRVREVSGNRISWSDGMLYPVLHRLEDAGFIESYWCKAETGRKRKYYRIRGAGIEEFTKLMMQWEVIQQALSELSRHRPEGGEDV